MSVSIIIPTFNEAACIGATLSSLRAERPLEIIVVDGGSSDETVARAAAAEQVLTAGPGRALQMNLGARHARGDHLLFLHADCTLQPGALAAAEALLTRRHVSAACFSMRVQAGGLSYRCIDAAATARVRLTGIAYGDQGLCLRRRDFERLGGFPLLRFMEDVFFSRRLKRLGRVVVLPHRIFVGPRRWQRVGVLRQSLRNWTLTALALAGVHPDKLAAYYPAVR